MIYRLGRAIADGQGLTSCLLRAKCTSATRELQEASSQGVATLEAHTCTEQSVRGAVEAAYHALEKAFHECMQKGIGGALFQEIRENYFLSDEIDLLAAMHTEAPTLLRHQISRFMRPIYGATTHALKSEDTGGRSAEALGLPKSAKVPCQKSIARTTSLYLMWLACPMTHVLIS